MRNLLALVGAVVVTVAGLGWYLDWFKVRSSPAPAGYRSVNIDINTGKISEDIQRGSAKVQEVLEKSKESAEGKSQPEGATKSKLAAERSAPGKGKQPDAKKTFIEEGEEAEEPPTDVRKPQ